jgi:hypothetical protein
VIMLKPWPDDGPAPKFGPHTVCSRCGIIGGGYPAIQDDQSGCHSQTIIGHPLVSCEQSARPRASHDGVSGSPAGLPAQWLRRYDWTIGDGCWTVPRDRPARQQHLRNRTRRPARAASALGHNPPLALQKGLRIEPAAQCCKTATLAKNLRVPSCEALFCRNDREDGPSRGRAMCVAQLTCGNAHRGGEVMISTSKNLKLMICLGGLLAPCLLASASLPAVGAGLTLDTVVTLPVLNGTTPSVLRAFDISFVDPKSHTYALAASALFCSTTPSPTVCDAIGPASMPGIVSINTQTKAATLLAVGQFAGNCPAPAVGQSGPNGLVIIGKEIWVGDAPIHTPSCTGPITTSSSVKVLDFSGNITHTILTGGRREPTSFAIIHPPTRS